ncbi:unnamed protein product [Owenia fusiformis]|uniref:SMB domain-containing protein n=1 Tax=Owenia fusiformis TaxID=6347 RepID=A0A8S4N2X7_OWEFU|nr:unnamed protein product [Owenia fusiformis]
MTRTTLILWVCTMYFGVVYAVPPEFADFAGQQFCSRRSRGDQCCTGRIDECSMPILDTVCYCDIFCDRPNPDCCPDYWEVCQGVPAPTAPISTTPRPPTIIQNDCIADGRYYNPGDVSKVNCQECTCVENQFRQNHYLWQCDGEVCLIRDSIIEHVNRGYEGWRAGNYSFLWGKTLGFGLKYRLGTFLPDSDVIHMTSLRVRVDERLPSAFDSRDEWEGSVSAIRDQGNCGSSWAFSTAAVASDRLALHSIGSINVDLSPQQLISCNGRKQLGCEGGHLDRAWWYMRKLGVVTEECYPYTSGQNNAKGKCYINRSSLRSKNVLCTSNRIASQNIYQSTPPYRIRDDEREIMKEILTNGPVQATFAVKEDFFMYRGGIYKHSNAPDDTGKVGYHSVRIVGWGSEQTSLGEEKYWIAANSWGTQWGENGYFRIRKGVNECDIESYVIGVWGKVDGRSIIRPDFSSLLSFNDGPIKAAAARGTSDKVRKGHKHRKHKKDKKSRKAKNEKKGKKHHTKS